MKYLYIFIFFTLLGCCGPQFCFVKNEDITNMYSSYVEEWQNKAKSSFESAEKEVFAPKPIPKPDDIVGPHPDPTKCICKGTGIIVHGDGHKTPCEYHSGQSTQQRGNVRIK